MTLLQKASLPSSRQASLDPGQGFDSHAGGIHIVNDRREFGDVFDTALAGLVGRVADEAPRSRRDDLDPAYSIDHKFRDPERVDHFDTHSVLSAPAPYLRPDRHLDAMSANCQEVFSTQQGYRGVNASLHWSFKAFGLLLIHIAVVLFVIAVAVLLGAWPLPAIEVPA